MTTPFRLTAPFALVATVAALIAFPGGCAPRSTDTTRAKAPSETPSPVGPRTRPSDATAAAATTDPVQTKDAGPRAASLRTTGDTGSGIGTGQAAIDAAKAIGPEAVEFYNHLAFLADPALEGRSADVPGNRIAAEYIEKQFRELGLQPAFNDASGAPTYQQPFKVRGEIQVDRQDAWFEWRENLAEAVMPEVVKFESGKDFNVLGCSGSGEVSGELAFAGYAVEDGPENYATFAKGDDLTGKIALVLRFEPMTAEGKSKWSTSGRWSQRAEMVGKIKAAASRGAAGVILVSPPGADDPRVEKLETARTTRFGGVNVPVVMMSIPAVNRILEKADDQGRSLLRLRQAADEKGGIITFGPKVKVTLATAVQTKQLDTTNIGAVLPGRGNLADQYLILGAHFDHVGLGYVGGANPSNLGKVHAGADDNASGTAGLILAADKIKTAREKSSAPARSIIFIAFGAEEMGLLGSDHYIKNPSVSASSIAAMLNMDMIGRMTDNKLQIDGVGTAENFETALKPALDKFDFKYTLGQSGRGPSDHASFYGADIPVLHLFTGLHPDYHQPGDTIEKVNVAGAVRVVDLLTEVTTVLASAENRLTFKSTGAARAMGSTRGGSVRLGIAPGDYSGSQPGVLVGEVFEGTSAANAGIKKGDRLMKWGGEELPDVESMMSNLSKHKPGDKVDIIILREGKEMTVTVTLLGREPRG